MDCGGLEPESRGGSQPQAENEDTESEREGKGQPGRDEKQRGEVEVGREKSQRLRKKQTERRTELILPLDQSVQENREIS